MTPEDYGALYVQWAAAIHRVDPRLRLGGPGFQTVLYGWQCWPDASGNTSWIGRFLAYLRGRGRMADYRFFSFEWDPFDQIGAPPGPQLALAPELLRNAMARVRREGLPADVPCIITEYGYSSSAGEPEVDLPGAILNAEIAAQFLTLGGKAAYLYGYEPNVLIRESTTRDTWGNLALFLSNDRRMIRCRLPAYYGARLISERWAQPGAGVHALYRARSSILNRRADPIVTAYAVHRPDGRWATLLLNKDPTRAHRARILYEGPAGPRGASGPAEIWQYGPDQYTWHAAGAGGYPTRNAPPAHWSASDCSRPVNLPPFSMTVIQQ
jgi:hypothetical protein